MTPEEFEALLRAELARRDNTRRSRPLDPATYEAADTAFLAAVMTAAGFGEPEGAEKSAARTRRRRRVNEDRAFGEAS